MAFKYKLTMELKNKYKLLASFNKAPQDLAEAIQSALMKTGGYTLGEVKKVTPVRTGMLRLNTHMQSLSPTKVIVTPNYDVTPYAEYVLNRNDYLAQTGEIKFNDIQNFFNKALQNFVNNMIRNMK